MADKRAIVGSIFWSFGNFLLYMGKGIGVSRLLHLLVGKVGINFSGAKIFMAENIFQNTDIDPAMLIHQGGGGMPELVNGIALTLKANVFQMLFDEVLHRLRADSLQTLAQKKGVSVFYMIHGTDF